jgi:hypothetical protein
MQVEGLARPQEPIVNALYTGITLVALMSFVLYCSRRIVVGEPVWFICAILLGAAYFAGKFLR